jgi:hypothetical protein
LKKLYDLSKLPGGRDVELVTLKFLNYRIKDKVMQEAQADYGT